METLEKGVYTAKVSQQEFVRICAPLIASCAERIHQSDIRQREAERAIMRLRDMRRIDPETGRVYYVR